MNKDSGFEVDFNTLGNRFSCQTYETLYASLLSSKLDLNSEVQSRVPPEELKAFCDELLIDLVARKDLQTLQLSVVLIIAISIVIDMFVSFIVGAGLTLFGFLFLFIFVMNSMTKKRVKAIA